MPKGTKFEETAYTDVIENLNAMQDVPILISPEGKEVIDGNSLVMTINLGRSISLENFLDLMVSRSEGALAYVVSDGAVIVTTKAKSLGKPSLRVHPVADLIFPVTNFAGPQIKDLPIGESEDAEVPRSGGPIGEKVRFVEPEALGTLVQNSVARGTWEGDGVSLEVTGTNMVVRHTPQVQAAVEAFLGDLRKFQTSLVTVESKFLRIERNYLKEIGVDIRGLGGTNAKGTVAQLDDITNGLQTTPRAASTTPAPAMRARTRARASSTMTASTATSVAAPRTTSRRRSAASSTRPAAPRLASRCSTTRSSTCCSPPSRRRRTSRSSTRRC